MKQYVSILSVLSVVLGAGYARASDCVGDGCDFENPFFDDEITETVDVLKPVEHNGNLWVAVETESESDDSCDECDNDDNDEIVDVVDVVETDSANDAEFCEYDNNCPFETAAECEIWYKKPAYKTSVAPRAPHLSPVKTDGILYTLLFQGNISANDELAKPL